MERERGKRKNTMVAQVELPEECWELIIKVVDADEEEWSKTTDKWFNKCPKRHLSPLSLVCKRFLSITNRLLFTLRFYDSHHPAIEQILPRLLRRFTHIKCVEFYFYEGDLDSVLAQIALSVSAGCCSELDSLKLCCESTFPTAGVTALGSPQMMKSNLKSLTCVGVALEDSHLDLIGDSFPSLEELDICIPLVPEDSNCISDTGVLSLSLKLKRLKTIDISGNHCLTDHSLEFLSTNCLLLSRLVIGDCLSISLNGISNLIHRRPSLNSIVVGEGFIPLILDSPIITSPSKALSVIRITDSVISDEFLYQVAQARLPLKKLNLFNSTGFSFSGISYLLNQYQSSLDHLGLDGVDFLTDTDMVVLSTFLRRVRYVHLSFCPQLTSITFYSLLRNCLVLNEIRMIETNVGDGYFDSNCNVISGVKSVHLNRNGSMCNDFLKTLASTCPKLECLSLSDCNQVAREGILEVLKRCSNITRLILDSSKVMNNVFVHLEFDLPKLKVLSLRSSEIDDDAAAMISKRCRRLLKLDLYECLSLTSKGVKAVVNNCKELMEMHLELCDNVSGDTVPWMVISRASLKKIAAPPGFIPTKSQSNLFLQHGCRLVT